MAAVESMRVAVCGGGGVGKSCLTIQFVQNQFVETWDPTIEDSYQKSIKVNDVMVQLDILDTAGQEEYRALRDEYMRTADGFLLVFDVTNRKSYDEVPDFFKHISRAKENDNPPLLIAANKCDIEESQRKISAQEIEQLSTKFRTKCLETSAKQRKNVDQAFHGVVSAVLAQRTKEKAPTSVQPTPGKKKCSLL